MADDTRSTVTVAIRRSSKSPAIFLAASFTEPAWEPVELDVKPIPPLASQDTVVQTNGHIPGAQYEFSKSFEVALGKHQYKFREGLEGSWFHDKEVDSAVDNGNESNVLVVEPVRATMKSADSPEKEDVENISNGSVSGVEKVDEVKVEHEVSKDDASETAIAEDVTSTEAILEAQDTKVAEDPLAAENVEASEADTTSKDVPELLENPVEDSHEARADSAPEPVVNELQIVEKEHEGQLQMKNDEGQNTGPAEKNDLAAPDVDEAEPVETEVATDPDATIDDKPPASEPANTPEPSQQDVVIETPVCEENEENPANAETSIDAAGEKFKSEETTVDNESPETEPKVVEQPSPPDAPSNLAPASIEEPEDPITPIHTEPTEPIEPAELAEATTAIDAPADSEPAQSQAVDENIITLVNGDAQKKDEGDKPAEIWTSGEESLESTPDGGIAELDTKPDPVPEEKPEGPDVQAPIMEVTAPESEQLVIKDDDSQAGNVIKAVESQDVNIDKEDEPSGEVANPIAQEAPDDVTPDASMEPQQQNAELVSEPTHEVAPAEDITAKAVVNDDTTGVPENEEPAGAGPDPAAPAPSESHEAAPKPEITPEIPVVSATEEPEAPTSEEATIPDVEPVTQQDVIPGSTEPESLVETEEPVVPDSSDEVVASKPEDDAALEPEPDTSATPEEPEAPESAADIVPETNANSREEPEASEPAADLELVQSSTPETEVADEQTTEKVVEPETSKSVDIADPAPDSAPDVVEISTAEEPAAPQIPGDLVANPATTDIPEGEVEQTEPETSKPIDGVVAELEPVVQTISTDVLDAPVEKTEPETSQLNGGVVSDLAEPAEVVLPAVPAPSTEVATVETPEAPEELRVPDTTKPADDVVADTAPVSENTASQIADASVEVTDSETLHPSGDHPEPIEPEELAKPIEPEPEPEPATEPPPVQAPEVPEDLKEPEDLDPDKDAVIPQPEQEPVPVATTSDITQASTEPSQPETSIDADNAVTQLDEREPKSAPEAPISEVAEDPTEAVEPDASEAIGDAVTKSEPVSVLTASETYEIPPEPTKAEDLPVVDNAVVEPTPEVAPEITREDAPDATVAPTTFTAERELEVNVDTNRDLESNEPETTIPATGETVGASAVVEESETQKTPEDTETYVAQEISTTDRTEPQAVSAPGLEQEVETPEIPVAMEEPKSSEPAPEDEPLADNITPDHKKDEVVTNGDRTDSTDKEEEQQEPLATELPVVIEDVPEPSFNNEPGVSKQKQQISDPQPIAVEEPEHATPAEEPEVEHTAEIESETNEPSQVTKTPVGLEGSKPELTEIEQPAVDSASALRPPQEPNPPPEIDQDIPNLATEEPNAEPELTPSTNFVSEVLPANEPATKNKSGNTFEPAVSVAVAAETDLEVSEQTKHAEPAEKSDGREPPTAAATLESSNAEIVADELESTSKSKEQPPASDPRETKASESDEPDTRKEFAVEIKQPTSLKTANYPFIESPIENSLSEPVVPHDNANAATEVPPRTQPKPEVEVVAVPPEEPFVGTNGTTSKSPVEEVPQAPLVEPAVKVAAATLTTALVGAGITQLVSNNEDPVADKDVPSTAPAEVFVSAVETSLSSAPEVTANGISRSSDKAKEEKAVVNGNNSSPVQESDGGATERVLAPANSQEESLASATDPPELTKQSGAVLSAKQAEVYTLPPTATSQTEPIPSISGEPEPTNKPSEPAAADSEPSPAPDATKSGAASGEAEEPRPTTAGDRSVTSITIHKRKNFFKALWHAIFTSFLGGVFSVFRRGRRDTTRQ
ncbi:PT repeat family protein [Histoplasma capsulatum]|uniref:PT repeat family protein n=2 Tax=Histoplasma TaxID=5036 RepID=A0A8A1M693_AJECA|nr:PT repeat family protein [Histoplasma capsulatum]